MGQFPDRADRDRPEQEGRRRRDREHMLPDRRPPSVEGQPEQPSTVNVNRYGVEFNRAGYAEQQPGSHISTIGPGGSNPQRADEGVTVRVSWSAG